MSATPKPQPHDVAAVGAPKNATPVGRSRKRGTRNFVRSSSPGADAKHTPIHSTNAHMKRMHFRHAVVDPISSLVRGCTHSGSAQDNSEDLCTVPSRYISRSL
jgi:hypothetical protein